MSSGDESDASDRFKDDAEDVASPATSKSPKGEDGGSGPSSSSGAGGGGMDLTGFLFANFLDESTREKLGGLTAMLGGAGAIAGGDEEDDDEDGQALGDIIQEGQAAAQDKTTDAGAKDGTNKDEEEEEFDADKKDPEAKVSRKI